jgi:hypothetical protein
MTVLADVGTNGTVSILARGLLALISDPFVSSDSYSDPASYYAAMCIPGESCAFFRKPKTAGIAFEACILSLSGERREKRFAVKKSELPSGVIRPVMVMPDGKNMLFQRFEKGSEFGTLYQFAFDSRHYKAVASDIFVDRVFGNVGSSGIILGMTQARARGASAVGKSQKEDIVGIVSTD